MQSVVNLIYPESCAGCGEPVAGGAGLCPACWVETWFITGHACDACGTPLPGEGDGHEDICDDCVKTARPWERGRAALLYKDKGRRMVLALKHGDRPDLATPAARWMKRAGADILTRDCVLVPVPIHWTRLFKRRYNQSIELGRALAKLGPYGFAPGALVRKKRTDYQHGRGFDSRFANVQDAIVPHPTKGKSLAGETVVLIDDVMTSGATLAATAEAARRAGAAHVHMLVLARAAKDA